jgi:threonine dehydrogenase-like Zn-dependent dehydrogenase
LGRFKFEILPMSMPALMPAAIKTHVARLLAPRHLVFEEETLETSKMPPDGVLAETLVSALSVGTEMAAFTGKPPLRPGPAYPRVVGYCNVARVLHTGPEAKNYSPGDIVLSFQSHRGAFICRESDLLLKIDQNMDLGAAATTYLFHLGYCALINSDFKPGHHVAVVGLGTLGIGTIACGVLGGGRMSGFSNQPESLRIAEKIGATTGLPKSGPESVASYAETTEQGGADIVVLTSDSWSDWLLALKLTRKKGTLAIIGFPGRGEPLPDFNPLDPQYVYDKHLRILSAAWASHLAAPADEIRFNRRRNCAYLLQMIAQGRLPARTLISREHDWRELPEVYQSLERRQGGDLTRLLRWK